LYRTTIVIWSTDDPTDKLELEDMAREATGGEMYCSKQVSVAVDDPDGDPDWDGTEFFEMGAGHDMDRCAEHHNHSCPDCHPRPEDAEER
jgi:hypothetical protein